jgi:hypothetical protein
MCDINNRTAGCANGHFRINDVGSISLAKKMNWKS